MNAASVCSPSFGSEAHNHPDRADREGGEQGPRPHIGDKMIVTKEGSSLAGSIVIVVDPWWNGMLKVDGGGIIKSYLPSDLEPISHEDAMELDEYGDAKPDTGMS